MLSKNKTVLAAVVLGTAVISPAANAGWSANFGFMSDYLFRGIYQTSSSAYTGLDFEAGGFYAGTWAADVDDGIEYDLYGGYGWEFSDSFSLSAGVNGYFYSDDWDDTYIEGQLIASFPYISIEATSGTWDGFGAEQDYTFGAVTVGDVAYITVGTFGSDFDGSYVELGYSKDVGDLSFGVALVLPDEDLDVMASGPGEGDQDEDAYLTIDVGYAFDL